MTVEVGDERLVYNQANSRVLLLNRVSASVFEHCDGNTSVASLIETLQPLPPKAARSLIEIAVNQMYEAGLLAEGCSAVTRKEFLATWGKVAVMLPLITSSALPTAAAAASGCPTCITSGDTGCGTQFGGARPNTCCPCTLGTGSCSGAFNCAVFANSSTGTSCLDDALVGSGVAAQCTIVPSTLCGGRSQMDCACARCCAIVSPFNNYICCECDGTVIAAPCAGCDCSGGGTCS